MHKIILATTALAVALSGCSGMFDDSDYARFEQPGPAYKCAAYLMRVEAPGPVPNVVWHDRYWRNNYYGGSRWADGEYVAETNTIHVRLSFRGAQTLVHESVHAIQFQRGEEYNEWEARKVERWFSNCPNFMVPK